MMSSREDKEEQRKVAYALSVFKDVMRICKKHIKSDRMIEAILNNEHMVSTNPALHPIRSEVNAYLEREYNSRTPDDIRYLYRFAKKIKYGGEWTTFAENCALLIVAGLGKYQIVHKKYDNHNKHDKYPRVHNKHVIIHETEMKPSYDPDNLCQEVGNQYMVYSSAKKQLTTRIVGIGRRDVYNRAYDALQKIKNIQTHVKRDIKTGKLSRTVYERSHLRQVFDKINVPEQIRLLARLKPTDEITPGRHGRKPTDYFDYRIPETRSSRSKPTINHNVMDVIDPGELEPAEFEEDYVTNNVPEYMNDEYEYDFDNGGSARKIGSRKKAGSVRKTRSPSNLTGVKKTAKPRKRTTPTKSAPTKRVTDVSGQFKKITGIKF
jgi:hypothetical protein